jgi:catechol 2,3-dioxygenase-like lactoylglutathione lyase family enzyme
MALLGSAGVHAIWPDGDRFAAEGSYINRFEMSAITQLVAGVPVSDLDASIDWYTRFFGRPPDMRVGDEVLWDIDEHATLFIEPNTAQAGAGRITFAVDGLDGLLEHLAAQRIEHEPIETYSNGVRHAKVPDPDGNAIAFAEPPDAG